MMSNGASETIWVGKEEVGLRIDSLLTARFQGVQSRTYFQSLIQEGQVLLNGKPVKKRVKPTAGDAIEVRFLITPEISIEPEPIPLSIIYEDETLLVVNKPAGMVVHPAPGHWSKTFVNALIYHCQKQQKKGSSFPLDSNRPGIVHRLDKDTSGVMIAAKCISSQQRLAEMFSARKVYKEYVAVCLGHPGHLTVCEPIGRHPVRRKEMAVLKEGGRSAVTHCETIAFDGKLSVVRLILETGRMHQIRVHLRHIGTPILGDCLYGKEQANRKYQCQRQLLHATTLRLAHPVSGALLECKAKLPDDLCEVITKIVARSTVAMPNGGLSCV